MSTHKISRKKSLTKSRFVAPQFIIFTEVAQNVFFWETWCIREHKIMDVHRIYFFRILTFKNIFFRNGSIYYVY